MAQALGYRCSICGEEYALGRVTYTCPADGGNLDVVLEIPAIAATTSPEKISSSRDHSIWRYLPLLPVEDPGFDRTPLRAVGWTPLFAPERLSRTVGLGDLWLKDDGRNPTASFKDRASAGGGAPPREEGGGPRAPPPPPHTPPT